MKNPRYIQDARLEGTGDRTLRNICSPEEMAAVLKAVDPVAPLAEVRRRRDVAARNGNTKNVRFWDEVKEILTYEKTASADAKNATIGT